MSTTTTMQVSPVQAIWKTFAWILRFALLVILYFILFAAGGIVAPSILRHTLRDILLSILRETS